MTRTLEAHVKGHAIRPMIRGNICMNADPAGCVKEARKWIGATRAALQRREAKARMGDRAPKLALVVGCSTGYGLASRAAALACGAMTVGVSFERAPERRRDEARAGSPGWYANRTFDEESNRSGVKSLTVEGDAFSGEVKARTIEAIRALGGKVDLVVYSLASPVRSDPATGETYRSAIKPIGSSYSGKTVDMSSGEFSEVRVEPATQEEAAATVKVMGGEDWKLWIDALAEADCLAEGATTVAYSYIGPEITHPIYRDGTIGMAKRHLEATARAISAERSSSGVRALVSVNKALVTRASSVIPVIPLYISALYKVMKDRNTHEGCVAQCVRLFRDRLYAEGGIPTDEEGRIRLDDWEMDAEIQREVARRMAAADASNERELIDLDGFRDDFLRAHGFSLY